MNSATQQMLHRKVNQLGSLPVMPSVLSSLGEYLSSNAADGNVDRIVELISYDKSLAAQCLRAANSALFGRRIEVDSVRRAVLALGVWRIRDVVYSCSLPSIFGQASQGMAPTTFWRHALGTALVSQHLAQRLGIVNIEKFYLAGLLHDIGILVNSLLCPKEFSGALAQAERSETPLNEVELKVLGFTHCDSGRILADLWKLPQDIAETIELHHHPASSESDSEMTCTVYLADILCRFRGLGYGYYEAREFDLASESSWQLLQNKYPAAAEMDVARFTFELDDYALAVQALVDSIFGKSPAENTSN
jgi:putative nucleotidyltransferase with HDIG domain